MSRPFVGIIYKSRRAAALKAGILISLSVIVFTPKFDEIASADSSTASIHAAMVQPAENPLTPLPRKDMRVAARLSANEKAN
jgi:hypothetical protein